MIVQLPVFQGYTVDIRLKQFRKIIPGQSMEFIAFDTEEGQKLWEEFNKQKGEEKCD